MQHRAACSSQRAIGNRLGMNPKVKMLQFAASVFDAFIGETIAPLIAGATVCVPSDYARLNSLVKYIQDCKVNWAMLTPSFARTIRPESVPSIKLLMLTGEAIPRDVFEVWVTKVRLINGWGPAETCVFSSLHEWTSIEESTMTIGKPVASFCWLVDPKNPLKLAPTGTLGEVIIQGPTLLREYLDDPKRTAEALLTGKPTWAYDSGERGWNRFYKTGDLCFYNDRGLLEFSSRKDTQLKIRGQRVEVGEVEHQIRTLMPDLSQVAVDAVRGDGGVQLFAYICNNADTTVRKQSERKADLFMQIDDDLRNQIADLTRQLRALLPSYMIPKAIIPCAYMPFITSTKLDRKTLNMEASKLSSSQIAEYALQSSVKRKPETEMEALLQGLWAKVLNLPPDTIGRDDSFLAIGGDSIAAVHLMAAAREKEIRISVDDVFRSPQLSELALRAGEKQSPKIKVLDIQPFELLNEEEITMIQNGRVHEICNLPPTA
uniref:Carrier domain-containing protein n=1 Tax=Bionectria ochroleuca TaxID=29856 RepID=A0A8H7KCL4_BIOOC